MAVLLVEQTADPEDFLKIGWASYSDIVVDIEGCALGAFLSRRRIRRLMQANRGVARRNVRICLQRQTAVIKTRPQLFREQEALLRRTLCGLWVRRLCSPAREDVVQSLGSSLASDVRLRERLENSRQNPNQRRERCA